MTRKPSDDSTSGPATPGELLARARRRGDQLRLRRRVAIGGTAAALAAALAVPLSLAGGGGPAQPVVQVANPSGTTQAPSATQPTTPPSSRTSRGTTGTSPSSVPTSTTVTAPSTSSTLAPTSTTTPAGPTTRTVTDADNGHTISIAAGSTLIVQLAADNWTIGPSSQPTVLAMQGMPNQQHTSCFPGGTCGTTTATFRAERAGQAQVSANRAYCGEAIMCQPSTDSWSMTVQVTG